MSYNIVPFNNTNTMENSQQGYFDDKLHMPTFDKKTKEPEYTVINIVGYVGQIESDDCSSDYKPTCHILPLTIQDLNQGRKKQVNPEPLVITNFIENLISTNKENKISNAFFTSFKSIRELLSEVIANEEKTIQPNNFQPDCYDYCDAV